MSAIGPTGDVAGWLQRKGQTGSHGLLRKRPGLGIGPVVACREPANTGLGQPQYAKPS